ncbi:MAG: hypothetical protein PQJ58_16245 [Spirochaetales bacterium]|nr:hypothetical protein [Spirochaetales bacterium]
MLSAIAVLTGFVSFLLFIIPGIIFFTLSLRKMGKTDMSRPKGCLIGLLWIILTIAAGIILITVLFTEEGSAGPPEVEDWMNLYKAFFMIGALPGSSIIVGGFVLRLQTHIHQKRSAD